MDLLKVFVGDGSTAVLDINSMVEGDLMLVKASDHSVLTRTTAYNLADSVAVQIVAKNSKGLKFSTPMKRSDVAYVNYKVTDAAAQKKLTATLTVPTPANVLSTTFSLGVQIKEDLRMGTYNKNTEIISSYTSPATALTAANLMLEMTSTIAKGFTANPLSSAGSPSQLVNVTRLFTSGTNTIVGDTGTQITVTKGGRQAVLTGTAPLVTLAVNDVIQLFDSCYIVEAYDATNKIITLDTAYQGETITDDGDTFITKLGALTAYKFIFEGVAQPKTNRYDKYRIVDFVAIYPKGFSESGIAVATTTALKPGIGLWSQVRDLEETAFTNVNPLINYREFPFEDFALNVNSISPSSTFTQFVLVHSASSGYNYMQSSNKGFPQTTIAAAVSGSVDAVVGDTNGFGSSLVAWWSKDSTPLIGGFV